MMKRVWKSVFSVLLAVALLLPMAPVVRADSPEDSPAVERIELSSRSSTIYYRNDSYNGTITLTATVFPSTYTGSVKWIISDNAPLTEVRSDKTFSGGTASITLKAENPRNMPDGMVTAEVFLGDTGKTISEHSFVYVKNDTVDTNQISFTRTEENIQVKESVQLSFNKAPAYPSDPNGVNVRPKVTYKVTESNPADVVSVSDSGVVTGRQEGTATITAYVDDNQLQSGSKVIVKVSSPSTDLTGSATLGTTYPMGDIYEKLRDKFRDTYDGQSPENISFPNLNNGVNATLRRKSGAAIVKDSPYSFSELNEMYLDPSIEGAFKFTASVSNGANKLACTVTINITAPVRTVRIPVDGSSNYVFSQPSADSSGRTGAQIIRDAIGNFGSIVFGAVSADSNRVGTLYTTTSPGNDTLVSLGTTVTSGAIDELYFTPSRAGTYTVPFTAYHNSSGYGTVACTGELILPVDGSSLDISVNLDKLQPYTFADIPSSGSASLFTVLVSAINGSVGGENWGGIKFEPIAGASSVGTLHETSAHISRVISADDFIAKSDISKLYFVPVRTGTYEIMYGVYSTADSTKTIATGKLTFAVSTIPAGTPDITYITTVKNSVTLNEADFIDFFQKENGSKYQLSYVVFSEYLGDGKFYHNGSDFVPYNSPDLYTSTYTGGLPANARYLNRVSFTAPSDSGYTAVLFTCYGGTGTDGTSKVTTGKLCIYYASNDVPAVTYNAYGVSTVDLREEDFVTAYNAAMKSSVSKPSFSIQLLNAPTKGALYYYYSTNSRRTLTANNIGDYTFWANNSIGSSINDLAYGAGSTGTGTDTITYMAISTAGALLYVGEIQFKLSTDLSINVTNDGSNFQLKDFYNANDNDPVLYVTFPRPSAGKVYVYTGGRYVVATPETKLYTTAASNGDYALTSAFYAPRANETGSVSIKCTVHRRSGATNDNVININVLSKISSGSFNDVSGVFNWAANSIDFASKMGLVNGTQVSPPLFSPADTMRRSDFVLMLYRLAGTPAVTGSLPYTDVPAGKYYYDSAVWAYQNNIMRNVTVNNLYNPEGALTRQDFAQILFNYATAMGESTANSGSIYSYSDASSVSANTVEGVTWAVARGYITSAVAGALYIEPTRAATRAEISTLLHRYLTY